MISKGKVAIITGAGSGIGKATALTFLNNDYSVGLAVDAKTHSRTR